MQKVKNEIHLSIFSSCLLFSGDGCYYSVVCDRLWKEILYSRWVRQFWNKSIVGTVCAVCKKRLLVNNSHHFSSFVTEFHAIWKWSQREKTNKPSFPTPSIPCFLFVPCSNQKISRYDSSKWVLLEQNIRQYQNLETEEDICFIACTPLPAF